MGSSSQSRKIQSALSRIEAAGLIVAQRITLRVLQRAIDTFDANKKTFSVDDLVAPFSDSLQKVMLASWYAGSLQGETDLKRAPRSLSLDKLDDILSQMRKKRTQTEPLKSGFRAISRRTAQTNVLGLRDKMMQTVNDLVKNGASESKARTELRQTLKLYGAAEQDDHLLTAVYRTHASMAYNGARYDVVKDADGIWGFKYVTAGDERVRKEHEELDQMTAPLDSDVWNSYMPPNGWNCRCQAIPIFASPGEEPEEYIPDDLPDLPKGFDFNPGEKFAK